MTDDYQAGATLYKEGWNHIKLVISGKQMKVYVNDLQSPAMYVPILEGSTNSGGISFQGNAIYANLTIDPDQVEGLSSKAGYDPTFNDSRFLRNWQISQPVNFPFGKDLTLDLPGMFGGEAVSDLPDSTTKWMPIEAENRGLINISRLHGLTEGGERRLIWLKTTIKSEIEQQRRLDLGFSDEVWVFINRQILHVDKNFYGTPGMKEPLGRCTLENSSINLPLSEGENEILIGIANYFYGWGIIARLDKTQNLQLL